MLKNENIICISTIDWDFIWQGNQEIMSTLAKNGNKVLFIDNTGVRAPGLRDISRIRNRIKNWLSGAKGIRQKLENLYVFSPIILPFPYLRLARWINRHLIISVLEKWCKVMDFNDPILWVFLPTPLSLDIADNLNTKLIIYHCLDKFNVSSHSAKKIEGSEIKLLDRSDLVFVTSRGLYKHCLQYNKNVHIFPSAVSFDRFEEVRLKPKVVPEELKKIKKPIIGYVGGMHKWMDLGLIKSASRKYPEYSFVFVGPVQVDLTSLSGLKNVYFLGQKDHQDIPDIVNNFDVCIIPYLLTDYTDNVYPAKMNEYLAMGKPVVATDLAEISYFNEENNNLVLTAKTDQDFLINIEKALRDRGEKNSERFIECARKNSWPLRIESMCSLIGDEISKKARQPVDWQDTIVRFYRHSRKKIVRIGAVVLGLYFLLFYTPIVWIAAGPLKISQPPEKADSIVVFGGGVGESGRAIQGYEERVQYAVELYKLGFAKNILFSSGYMYVFREPLVMKALAVSLGVPESAIFIEDQSHNTYQNVDFSRRIAVKKGWKSILVVSSPYHMRRVKMVVDKNASELKVTYTPIPFSVFYQHSNRFLSKHIELFQIRGILHEYLGIVYYLIKGLA